MSLLVLVALTAACGPSQVSAAPPASVSGVSGTRGGVQNDGPPADPTPVRLLFVGASVTEGWFASSRDRAYPELVARSLKAGGRHVRLRIVARAGATAEDADQWDLAIASDVVVVQIATNDFVRGVPLDTYAAAYARVLNRLRLTSATAELICFGAWYDPAAVNRSGVAAASYGVAARTACGAVDGRYVDLSAAYLDPRNHGPAGRPTFEGPGDEFHPNDRGHAALASLVLADDDLP